MPARRILFLLPGASFGGVERQAELMAEAAKSEGHRVSLVVLGDDGPAVPRLRPHCESIEILKVRVSNDAALWSAVRAAARTGHDAAFLFSGVKFTVMSNALRAATPRQILHVGNPIVATASERWKQRVRSWVFPPSRGLTLLANSQHTLRSLQSDAFHRRFPVRLSLNCVRIPDAPLVPRETCRPIRIGMVARLDPIKDHATLIRAVALLDRQGVPVRCQLVGRGSMEDDLKRLAAEHRLVEGGSVEFSGWSAEVEKLLRQWDIFIFSTTAREGFGNAAAEAMAQGLPCIFSDVGPCREVGGDAVCYVPPRDPAGLADRITELAGDFARRKALGLASFQRAKTCFQPARKLADFLSVAFSD